LGTDFIKRREAEGKLQTPTSNRQRNTKAQAPNVNKKPDILNAETLRNAEQR
jgi:hypothetical protein